VTHLKTAIPYGRKLISFTSIFLAFIVAIELPRVGGIATAYLLIYAVILYKNVKIWPILLLFSVPLFNFTPYTGRYAVNEFDSLILLTFGLVWFKQKKLNLSNTQIELKIFLLLIFVSLISGLNALASFPPLEDLFLTVYQQQQNIWRVSKSLFYALLLYLLIHHSNRKETGEIIRNFAIGAFISIITLVLITFWEKNVLHAVFSGASPRTILNSALQFSIDLRPTALFSAMHTGGGSLDSYIGIMFIFPILLLYGQASTIAKNIFLVALLSGLYCAFATVSRTIIASTAVTTAIIVILYIYKANNTNTDTFSKLKNLIQIIALLTFWATSLFIVQPLMGTEGILFLPIFTFAFAISLYQLKCGRPYILGIVFILCTLIIGESILDFLEKGINLKEALYKGGILIGLIALNVLAFVLQFKSYKQLAPLALPLLIFIIGAIFIAMGFSSASLTSRLSEISIDANNREHHWNTVKNTGSDSLINIFFGNGPGTMPLNYPLAYTGSEYFTAKQKTIDGTLSITASNQSLTQRIQLQPEEIYTLHTSIRGENAHGYITAAICNRNILIQTTNNKTCKPSRVNIAKVDEWQNTSILLSTEKLQKPGVFTPPTSFEINFKNIITPIEISHLSLVDSMGKQILYNEKFERGLDYWFWVSDFQHLGWHSKNAFLHQYFELGALGLLLTLLLITSITLKAFINRKMLDLSIQATTYSLSVSFILLGSFITILDDPQIATFWYLGILICSLILSDSQITLPTQPQSTSKTLQQPLAPSVIQNQYRVPNFNRKNKMFLATLLSILVISISTDFHTRYGYNTSPPQVLARFKSDRLAEMEQEYPYFSFFWELIDNFSPEDERFK